MKHILNNISEEEKNAIREQHTGGMKLNTKKFKQLLETKQGDVKPLLTESAQAQSMIDAVTKKMSGGAKPDPKLVGQIKECITTKQLTSLMFLTTSAGSYALGIVAMLCASGVGFAVGAGLALVSALVIFITGLSEDQGGLGADPTKDIKALLSCMGIGN
jgi:hypothetical protein